MTTTAAPDLATGFPRSGREELGGFAWLPRLADKVRADHAGTAGDYVAYCPLSMGFLTRTGVSRDAFDRLVRDGASDADLGTYFQEHAAGQRDVANAYVLNEMASHLDEQDAEEGR